MNDDATQTVSSPLQLCRPARGMTLVELMIVVAIVGVLASIAIASYSSYVEEGRMTELRQYAMDVERGQQQFFSRHHEYFQPSEDYDSDIDGDNAEEWHQLLEFNARVQDEVTIEVEADVGGGCNMCATGLDPTDEHDGDEAWYAIRVENSDLEYEVYLTSEHDQPIDSQR